VGGIRVKIRDAATQLDLAGLSTQECAVKVVLFTTAIVSWIKHAPCN